MTDKLYFDATARENHQPNTFMRSTTILKRTFLGLVAGILGALSSTGSAATVTFQQGTAGYAGAVDTYLSQAGATTAFGTNVNILVDNDAPIAHGLIRFDDIFGPGAGQVPLGATISSATLTLRTFNDGDTVRFHRMLSSWAATDTWNSLVNGISADSVEALSAIDATFTGANPVPRVDAINVTASVQSWADGLANNGWAILPTASNGLQLDSADATTVTNRPLLTITFTVGVTNPVAIVTQPQDIGAFEGGSATFSVSVSGNAPRYQWFRGNSSIPNATNSFYQIATVQNSDAGLYRVVVSNSLNSVTSRDALLSVSVPPYTLVGLTSHVWRYEESNTDLGTAWRATNYNDTTPTWKSGLGVFAFENNAVINALTNTVLTLGTPSIITHYFRTSFVFTNDPAAFFLVSSNYLDDGAVVYLNGVEAFRYNMPAGNVAFATSASAANPAGEGVPIVSNLPPSLVRVGTNVIAVEVHQNGTASSDIVFGMAILVAPIPPTPLSIVSQPQSLVLDESQTASFTVGVQGGPAYFRWYKNGSLIPGATVNPFTIPITIAADAGNYFAVVSNSVSSVTSSVVTLTIIPDTNAPVLLEADGTASFTNILVSFSERVRTAGATNVNNYRVANTIGGVALTISSATLMDGTNVMLATSARTAGQNYVLVVNRLQDLSPTGNVIATNSSIPVRSLVSLVAWDSQWRFYDPYEGLDVEDLGTAWREFTYNTDTPNQWFDGSSVFYDSPDESEIPGPLGKDLSQTPGVTSYFRKGFDFQASPGGLQLSLTHQIDDGAVFYLNGTEVLRYNMPDGTINYRTLSATAIGDVTRVGPVNVVFGRPRLGANLLAVELHQSGSNNFDKIFGIQLDARAQSFVVGPVVITGQPKDTTVSEGSPANFEAVQAGGLTFQWQKDNVVIPGATNPVYTIPNVTLAMNGSQYRVTVVNPTSSAVSSNATLRVVADTNAPVLLGAVLTTNGTVVASFSEGMGASATLPSNYRLSNSAGANISITGAVISNNTNVVLTVGALPANSYTLAVSSVQDKALAPNTISPNPSFARLGFEGPLQFLSISNTWKYEQSGSDLGVGWRAVGYNDSAWPSGDALLAVEDATMPVPIRTTLTLGPLTYYFRTTFNSPLAGSTARLRIRTVMDDGGVFYLNGSEIQRVRITANPVLYATLAGGSPAEGAFEDYDVVLTNLVAGPNVVAVEVHQTSANSSDIVFGAQLTLLGINSTIISVPPPTNGPVCTPIVFAAPTLRYQKFGTNFVLSWTNSATNSCGSNTLYILQGALNLSNSPASIVWSDLGTQSPYTNAIPTNTVPTAAGSRFFRLRR